MKKLLPLLALMFIAVSVKAQTQPTDVLSLGSIGSTWEYGITNNYDIGACVERELHDGQWLAGGCKDVFYILHQDSSGNYQKSFHLGGAYMSNAQHGNQSFQLKAGIDMAALGTLGATAISLIAPKTSSLTLPPWVGKVGNMITLDFAGGYRPIHDSSVNGNWTYGIAASVNVPITTTFQWLIAGL